MLSYLQVVLVISVFIPFSVFGFCGTATRRISDPLSCRRYRECSKGIWKIVDCPDNTTFDGKTCSKTAPCQIDKIAKTTPWESGQSIPDDNTAQIVGNSESRETLNKTITNASHRRRRATTYKSYREKTEKKNGRIVTTLWYYNSNGPSYKFSVFGDPPAPKEEMIDWLEANSHLYNLTPVKYLTDIELSTPAKPNKPAAASKPTRTNSVLGWTADKLLPSSCGLYGDALISPDKVTNGHFGRIEDSPWQAAIIRKDNKELWCGGSIISTRHVVTATHCFQHKKRRTDTHVTFVPKEERLVTAGHTELDGLGTEYEIMDLYLHNFYNVDTKRNDVALILIDGEFTFGLTIQPICLPSYQERFSPGRECNITGWGKTASHHKYTETKLRTAVVKIREHDVCKKEYSNRQTLGTGMVCAANEGGTDTCQGDSGGPLACEEESVYKLFGVTSWGLGCGDKMFPGVYTKVPEYVNWIKNRVEVSMGARDKSTLDTADDYVDIDPDDNKMSEPEVYVDKDVE